MPLSWWLTRYPYLRAKAELLQYVLHSLIILILIFHSLSHIHLFTLFAFRNHYKLKKKISPRFKSSIVTKNESNTRSSPRVTRTSPSSSDDNYTVSSAATFHSQNSRDVSNRTTPPNSDLT
jgi:hypothetical protein